jgi:hypothetical protein
MIEAHHRPEPTFTVMPFKNGSGYYVLMDPNAYAPMLHIGEFTTEAAAEAWIRPKFASLWYRCR